jgi:hypothetical protein
VRELRPVSVARVLEGCYRGVTRVLQECYKSVTRVLQECYKNVTRVLNVCYKSVNTQTYQKMVETAANTTGSMFAYCIALNTLGEEGGEGS